MLKLKDEIRDRGEDVIIFVSKQRGRKLRFPIDTDPKDYPKFKRLGFDIFRCTECLETSCYGDHTQVIKVDGVDAIIHESIEPGESNMELKQNIEEFEKNSKTAYIEATDDEVTDYIENDLEYDKMSLKELRELFPDIKDTSKKGFIEKIKLK